MSSSCCKPSKQPSKRSCCGEQKSTAAPISVREEKTACNSRSPDSTHEDVSEYYGKTITSTGDLLTSACKLEPKEIEGSAALIRNIHPEILEKFYGCGSPIPPLLSGATVLDLGCGTGRDAYTVSQLVGEDGQVIGIDMTLEQLQVAEKHVEWHQLKFGHKKSNVEFHLAFIEDLSSAGVEDSSVDVVISNCVINLVPDKEKVLREVHRVLKEGGELFFSDVYTDRRVPQILKNDKVLFGECLSGALYIEDLSQILSRVGLVGWGVVHGRQIKLSEEIKKRVGGVRFFSLTIRAFKVARGEGLAENSLEDYQQKATYSGSVPGQPSTFTLDSARSFPCAVPVPVDSTTAAVLSRSRYSSVFHISEAKSHQGYFAGWPVTFPFSARVLDELAMEEGASCC